MGALGIFFAGLWIVVPMALLALLVVVVVGIAGARSEPDPHNHRMLATYLTAVAFVLVFTVLLALTAGVASLASLVDGEAEPLGITRFDTASDYYVMRYGGPFGWYRYDGNAAASGSVAAFLVAAAAGAMLWHYRRTLLDLLEREGFRGGPGARVVHTYLYASQFVAVLLLIGAGAAALYGLAQVVAPGVLSDVDSGSVRNSGVRLLLTAGALAAGSAAIAVLHMREHDRVDRAPDEGIEPPPVA